MAIQTQSDQILKDTPSKEEEHMFTSLRASSWDEFCGQEALKKNLRITIDAAKIRGEAVEHVLLHGPPGLGKTTLAHLIGKEMQTNVRVTSGPAIERSGDLASILTNLSPHDILFIDEIHRLNKIVEETLYPAMEDRALDIIIGKGPSARTLRLDLPPFTIVGATTRIGLMSAPMRDRFGVLLRLEFYTPKELLHIITKATQKLAVTINPDATAELAKRSRGTPRIGLRLLKRARDMAHVSGTDHITKEIVNRTVNMLDVDDEGLDSSDRKILSAIIKLFGGGPVGIETVAAAVSEDIGTIEDVIEPYLLQIGFLKRTPRGRTATEKAWKHLNITPPQSV